MVISKKFILVSVVLSFFVVGCGVISMVFAAPPSGSSPGNGDGVIQILNSPQNGALKLDGALTNSVVIDSNGVGIGTNPNTKLTVQISDGDALRLQSTNTTPGAITALSLTSGAGANAVRIQSVLNTNNELAFLTGGSERVRIDRNGNVGIGNTNPATILDISGAFNQRGMAAPAVSPSGQGRIYFDSTANKFKASQNGAAYVDLVGGGGGGAPIDANYITQTTNTTLSNEQALSLLTPGYMKVAAGGIIGSQTIPIPVDDGGTGSLNGSITGIGALTFRPGSNSTTAIQLQSAGGASTILNIDSTNARVGIGLNNPATKLEVLGTLTVSTVAGDGVGKINAGTVDPPYTINGKKYATYLPSMTGVKEETTGIVNVECLMSDVQCEYVVDFNTVPEGSDLWLFSKVTNLKNNFDKMVVMLTPSFDGRVWYQKDAINNQLIFYAVPANELTSNRANGLELSYRLTAPRFDADKWSNYNDGGSAGFIIND